MAEATSGRAPSSTPVPTTETNPADAPSALPTDDEWTAMQDVLNAVYAHRTEDGHDPSKLFHRKVNKRNVPDYFDVIKEPMAMSQIKSKIANKEYKSFAEFVRDFALIPHNAQVYNRADSGAYQDALVVKEVLEKEFAKLVETNTVTEEVVKLPYLGEIPPQDALPEVEEEEEEEEEEEDEDEDEAEESDEEGGKRKKRRGPRSTAAIAKREGTSKEDTQNAREAELRKKRGRPPRVDTPMEARIKNIIKAMRKPKGNEGKLKISHFERLPDKAVMPEYFAEIKNPIAMDVLKKKLKRKKYQSVDQFMKDVETMFENAKAYNEDDSQIYKDAVDLQKEARVAVELERKKPDTDYVMEDGRLPMPNGILHNGELWKVGDWVHIQNANDLTKPIVAQIYRTWQDQDGGEWVNACWYYRPEQTVHRFDRHFFESEVVKTGQYRDHRIDEVVDRCFVMFFTRFNKGRPRGFPSDKEVYVCEARYNEEKHKLNKIKTWASCLPDEVREKDYEMDLFEAPRKMRKVPSPIAYLLKDDAKETDDLPKPEWGAENAPPKIGAVHKRPRDPKESPPPEPTPTPPPQPPPPPRQPSSQTQVNGFSADQRNDFGISAGAGRQSGTPSGGAAAMPTPTPTFPRPFSQQSASPAASASAPHGHHHASAPTPTFPPSTPLSFGPSSAHPPPTQSQTNHHSANATTSFTNPAASSATGASTSSTAAQAAPHNAYAQAAARPAPNTAISYKQPPAPEVYHLADAANASIPPDIRAQFHCDAAGRVLFFTAPPLDVSGPAPLKGLGSSGDGEKTGKEGSREREGAPGPAPPGHTPRFLAARARRDALRAEKRKLAATTAAPGDEAGEAAAYAESRGRAREVRERQEREFAARVGELAERAVGRLGEGLAEGAREVWEGLFPGVEGEGEGRSGPRWRAEMGQDVDKLVSGWAGRAEVRGRGA